MLKTILLKITFFSLLISIPNVLAHSNKKKSLKSHEHGVGILNIAQEDNSLLFEFEIPGFDIVGFEYKAESDEDIEKVAASLRVLSDFKNMLVLPASAECTNTETNANVVNDGKHSEFIAI